MEEIIKGAEKVDEGVSNRFEYQLREVLEKNKVGLAAVYFHEADKDFNRIEALYFGCPDMNWVLTAFELMAKEAKLRHQKGGLSSAVEKFPDADPDAVKAMKAKGIDVQ